METRFVIKNLDELLTLEQAASAWGIDSRELSAKSKGEKPAIPGIWINQRLVRFHPRAMLAKAAYDSGVPVEVIAAMFNLKLSDVTQ